MKNNLINNKKGWIRIVEAKKNPSVLFESPRSTEGRFLNASCKIARFNKNLMRDKKGWIRIVEAFIAILLIIGAVLIVTNKGYFKKTDTSVEIYDSQVAVLKEIELDSSLRKIILEISDEDIPLEWGNFPKAVSGNITKRIPSYLECKAKICQLKSLCSLDEYSGKDVYAQAVAIVANTENYNPRQLKLFCWQK